MNPFRILGIADNTPIDDARVVWRKLRGKYHPDQGGEEAKFKEVKAAWEAIEGGFRVAPPAPAAQPRPSTSFAEPLRSASNIYKRWAEGKKVGPVLPATALSGRPGGRSWNLKLRVTPAQAEKGCIVPYTHEGEVMEYVVPPRSASHVKHISIPKSNIIGVSWGQTAELAVELEVR